MGIKSLLLKGYLCSIDAFCIFFTYKSMNTIKNSANEDLSCCWDVRVLPYYHLVAVKGKYEMIELNCSLLLLASVSVTLNATTNVVLNNWFPSFEVFGWICSLWNDYFDFYQMCTVFKSSLNAKVHFWLRSENCAQRSSMITPWS